MNKRAGFTLVELMIAMIAGAFAVAGVYYLNGVSARSYAQQLAVSDAQMSLRSAMEQVRRDVARAGYLAAPTTAVLRNCLGNLAGNGPSDNTSQQFQAVTVGPSRSLSYAPDVNSNSGTQVNALIGANRVAADDLTMFGNFATADAYLANPVTSSSTVIALQANTESFRRGFFTPGANNGAATANTIAFSDIFAPGRMLRVEHAGRFFFRQIQARQWVPPADPQITLAAALPGCVETTGWMAVAPVSRVHYGLESDLTPDFSRLRADASLPGSRRALLVRREETTASAPPPDATSIASAGGGFTALTAMPNTARVVLDYAVEFGVSAVRNTAVANARPTWAYAITPAELAVVNAAPQNFRSLIVTLSSRSAEVDPRLAAVGGTRRLPAANFLGDPLLTFNVLDPNFAALTTLQARVRTLRSEIFLQNL